MADRTGDRLRKYPALSYLVAAGALALILPSALSLPTAGPDTLAEYAPQSGEGSGISDLGALEAAGGSGIGFGNKGSKRGTDVGDADIESGRIARRAGTKHCVGNPPRQTEDPLSPQCLAFFDGDNGGATATGVTREEIRVVIQLGASTSRKLIDYGDPNAVDPSTDDEDLRPYIQALARYFNSRYQTYGRQVHFWGYRGGMNDGSQMEASTTDIITSVGPFATIAAGLGETPAYGRAMSAKKVLSVTYDGYERGMQAERAPYLLSFVPDLNNEAAIAGSAVCSMLSGRPARFSGNLQDRSRTRKFGILWTDSEGNFKVLRDLLRAQLDQCGETVIDASSNGAATQSGSFAVAIAEMKAEGVTTLIPLGSSGAYSLWANAAAGQEWYPEWFIPGASGRSGADRNGIARQLNPVEWANAFGISYDRKRGVRESEPWYRAFREGCPECADFNDGRAADIYDLMVELFWGIQAAGPRLTPSAIVKGLSKQTPRSGRDVPTAYFAPNDWSWIKDAVGIRWSAASTEPGTGSPGCYLLIEGGARYQAGEWPSGDDAFANASGCQGTR